MKIIDEEGMNGTIMDWWQIGLSRFNSYTKSTQLSRLHTI